MYDTDEEQIEALKRWWLENGNMVIGAILVFAIAYFGINFYKGSVENSRVDASAAYQQFLELTTDTAEMDENQRAEINNQISLMRQEHGKSIYAIYASLYGAKFAVENNDLDQAAAELNWALDQKLDSNLNQLVQLRLARIEFARGNEGAALRLLDNESGEQLVGFEEVRGDILLSQGNAEQARVSYQKAWDAAQTANLQRPILEMKLNDLAID